MSCGGAAFMSSDHKQAEFLLDSVWCLGQNKSGPLLMEEQFDNSFDIPNSIQYKYLQFYSALIQGTIYYVSGVCCSQVRQTEAASVQIYGVCIHCGKTLQRDFKTGWNISLISVIKITDEADYCSHHWCWINEGWTKGILRTGTEDSDRACTPAFQVTHFTLIQTLCSGQILMKPPQTFQKSCSHFVFVVQFVLYRLPVLCVIVYARLHADN